MRDHYTANIRRWLRINYQYDQYFSSNKKKTNYDSVIFNSVVGSSNSIFISLQLFELGGYAHVHERSVCKVRRSHSFRSGRS